MEPLNTIFSIVICDSYKLFTVHVWCDAANWSHYDRYKTGRQHLLIRQVRGWAIVSWAAQRIMLFDWKPGVELLNKNI